MSATSLPPLIEIDPSSGSLAALVTVPGSKSITNRALILAALSDGEVTLRGALWSEDTQVMVGCLQDLGYMVNVAPDPVEPCNRTLTVYGRGPDVPRGGTVSSPLSLHVGNAGTAARFLSAMVCLGQGVYRLHGVPRMHERPQAAMFDALRQLGYAIESPNDRLPALVHGQGPRPGACRVSIGESSQFASALMLAAGHGKWRVEVTGENAEESPYVAMTARLLEAFPGAGGTFHVEPDASSGSYFWAAGRLMSREIGVRDWPATGWQIDGAFPKFLTLPEVISRLDDLGDSIMTAIVLASVCATHPVRFTDLGRLRVQECERVAALKTELGRCGARVEEDGDTLTVFPSAESMHGAEIETYEDHRMAMCFSILGLKIPGIKIKNPACVKKTFPNFYQKLAAPSPQGLGVTIRDGRNGQPLPASQLLADGEVA